MENKKLLNSIFVIDGVRQDFTLGELLGEGSVQKDTAMVIVDESPETVFSTATYEEAKWQKYGKKLLSLGLRKAFDVSLSESSTIKEIQSALISTLFCQGNFSLEDLLLDLNWKWNIEPAGNAAALYNSVQSAVGFVQDLGVGLNQTKIERGDGCRFSAEVRLENGRMNLLGDEIYIVNNDIIESEALSDDESYLIYVPFEFPDRFALEGTVFSKIAPGIAGRGDARKTLPDPDYFIDCYEVIRELITDSIAMSAVQVGYGGLYRALTLICAKVGVEVDLNSVASVLNREEVDVVKLLFAEVPGVVLQISLNDFEYFDSQLLLEDIAYFPLGCINTKSKGFTLSNSGAMQMLLSLLPALAKYNR